MWREWRLSFKLTGARKAVLALFGQGRDDGFEDALLGVLEGSLQDSARSEAMAAASECFRHFAHIGGVRTKTDLDSAFGLLHEKHFQSRNAAEEVHQILGILGNGAGGWIVFAADFAVHHPAVRHDL